MGSLMVGVVRTRQFSGSPSGVLCPENYVDEEGQQAAQQPQTIAHASFLPDCLAKYQQPKAAPRLTKRPMIIDVPEKNS